LGEAGEGGDAFVEIERGDVLKIEKKILDLPSELAKDPAYLLKFISAHMCLYNETCLVKTILKFSYLADWPLF